MLSQLKAPTEWYKHSLQLVSSVIKMVFSPTDCRQLARNLEELEKSKSRRYSYSCAHEQETWELEKQLHTFLFSTLHDSQWSASSQWPLYNQQKKP
jgi:hypothetical protein